MELIVAYNVFFSPLRVKMVRLLAFYPNVTHLGFSYCSTALLNFFSISSTSVCG